MDDDNTKEDDNQPSASKKESQRMTSTQDVYERRKYEERTGDDHGSNSMTHSESFTSGSYSARSRLDMADASPKLPKPPIVKRDAKPPEKKKSGRGRRPGRVGKRRRSPTRRAPLRRVPKRKTRKERDLSVSTIFTRLSSLSESRNAGCKFCGHRCCRRRRDDFRRFEYQRRFVRQCYNRKKNRRIKKKEEVNLKVPANRGSKIIQVGSRSMMLSPLFIRTNTAPPEELPVERTTYCEVTPEMIYQAMRRLTMWRQFVLTGSIMDYLKVNYPVNSDEKELYKELSDKLQVAAIVGIVSNVGEEQWSLQKKTLDKSHVTRFWQTYGDTMKPVTRQKPPPPDKSIENQTNSS